MGLKGKQIMKLEKISALQLFYVIVGFEIGNTLIYGLGSGAKQDAWLVLVFAMVGGLILMYVYTKLSAFYPGDSLVQMLPKILGKYLSYPVILIYICYFTYLAARACRDFGELIASTILDETPISLVIGSFMVLMIFCLRGGVETFGRMGEVVFPVYIFSVLLIWILLLSVDQFNIQNLAPILGNGVKPVLKEVFPAVLTFPFGESIIITMFFPYLNNTGDTRKVGMSVILVSGILLTMNLIMILSVLGPEIYNLDLFPLLSATRMVSIADFLERFDALIILLMVAGVFFKVGGWTFGAAVGISQLFKLKQSRSVLLGLGTIIPPLSLVFAADYSEFIETGFKYVTLYVHVPLQIMLPIFLLCVAIIRNKFNAR
jgi:spore germination protein KB